PHATPPVSSPLSLHDALPISAWRIRALGPSFHALAEIHYATWTRWVASTGSSWYQAGTTARERMAAAGYDVTQGDTWVVNEVTRSEEHTSELQSRSDLVCRLL